MFWQINTCYNIGFYVFFLFLHMLHIGIPNSWIKVDKGINGGKGQGAKPSITVPNKGVQVPAKVAEKTQVGNPSTSKITVRKVVNVGGTKSETSEGIYIPYICCHILSY